MHLGEECVRVIEIHSSSSLLELHNAIQDAVHFDRDHLFEFFAGRSWRNRKLVFDDSYDWDAGFDKYESLSLEHVCPLPKSCKLYYHFDFGDDWYFEIRKSRKKPTQPEVGASYPRVVKKIGPNPPQYGAGAEELDVEREETENK